MNTGKTILCLTPLVALSGWWLCRETVTPISPSTVSGSNGPVLVTASGAASARSGSLRDIMQKLLVERKPPRLTAEQIRTFVEKEGRSASSLLGAWKLGGGDAWLNEAASRFPDDPRVALAKISMVRPPGPGAEVWIERLKRNDPKNAAGWCCDALRLLHGGDTESARAALAQAAGCGRLDGYLTDIQRTAAKAYRTAGYEGFEAELYGCAQESTPLAGLALEMQRKVLSTPGMQMDDGLIQDLLAFSKLVRGSTETPPFMTHVVAMGMEEGLLTKVGGHEILPGTEKFVFERLDEIAREKASFEDLRRKAAPLLLSADESELKQFLRRRTLEGDVAATKWLLARHPDVD